ncbi:ribosomal protein S8e/ribosomal biogenesis NSA2 [Kipferlia bialata]|uniref:Ribosomal protein S8e/ribosomal biogenesis NSA2 n=2 Tax=Kipferlia bialata TaxID=797122 RepID=A0A9K3GGU4_9EUKA|nr:ribosomal protein S8e/ribosomal biogenesis NSA2 [Kipferlia bialata]|eukprot:g4842.t1
MQIEKNEKGGDLLFCGFNQDNGCIAVGTKVGFRIFNADPFVRMFSRDIAGHKGGIRSVEMLFRTSILALVGSSVSPPYSPHKVVIWDDHNRRILGEINFRSMVRAVKLRKDRIVVALKQRVYVYSLADFSLIDQIETLDNELGLLALCPSTSTASVMACPGIKAGQLRIQTSSSTPLFIECHQTALQSISVTLDGSMVATASGTIIEVDVSDLGLVTQSGKVVWGKYAQVTNHPDRDGCINAIMLV